MRTLAEECAYRDLAARLGTVTIRDRACWGRMNVYQMLRHVAVANRVPLGEIEVGDCSSRFRRTVIKWGALYSPTPWPKNAQTLPEFDQCRLGLVDGDFEAARREVLDQLGRLHVAEIEGIRHPLFGVMTPWQWQRCLWLHADHHLRQFGR